MSPTHNWTHFEAEEKKSLILSLVLYLLCPLWPHPLPPPLFLSSSLYWCGYLISTIDTKFLFLVTIVLCCAEVRHLVDKSKIKKDKRKDFLKGKKGRERQGPRPMMDIFFCILCEYWLGGDISHEKERKKKQTGSCGREGWKTDVFSLSFGILCLNCDHFSRLLKLSSKNGE